MSRMRYFQSVLLGFVGMMLAAGCSPSSDDGDDDLRSGARKPVSVVQPIGQLPENQDFKSPADSNNAPPTLPDEPDTPVPVEPAQLPAATDPQAVPDSRAVAPDGDPETRRNPLREAVQPPPADPATPPPEGPPPESSAHENPAHEAHAGGNKREPFDPVKVNGPIFEGWPPNVKLALVITGRLEGYIEPCGCAGLDRMKGGLSRRHGMFRKLRQKGWPVVGLDVGGLAKGYGLQAEFKFRTVVRGMEKMGYKAIALGTSDLRLQELASEVIDEESNPSPFLSANVAVIDWGLTARTRIVEAGGMKVAVTAVLGKDFIKEVKNSEVLTADPDAALAKVVPELRKNADYLILLAHATREKSRAFARNFPDFDLVVTAGGGAEPPAEPETIPGTNTRLIEVGEKGMNAVVWAFCDDPREPFRYQRVPMDSRFPHSEHMRRLMEMYQEDLGRSFHKLVSIGEKAPPHPQREPNGEFVGSKKCESCHDKSYRIWKKSGHAKALKTLDDLKPPRSFDPECISCHVIGWHPTEYFPYRGGFQSRQGTDVLKATPELADVGCESCHGPGGAHVKAEMGNDPAEQKKLQAAVRVTKAESEKERCIECHDGENSPDFDFETYWPKVEHYEELEELE